MFDQTSDMYHRTEMAKLVSTAAAALSAVNHYWDVNRLPGDFSTPETGFPFAMSLDEQCAAIWTWAQRLRTEDPRPSSEHDLTAAPDPAQVIKWARAVMAEITEGIAAHWIPLGLRTFADLHSYQDANMYLIDAAIPWGRDCATESDPDGVRFCNAVEARVTQYLGAVADMLAYDLALKCSNPQHAHMGEDDGMGGRCSLGYELPMTCNHCRVPLHFDDADGSYVHDELGHGCWLAPDPDPSDPNNKATPCTPDYTSVDMDRMVRILNALDIPAEMEMTGGGVATLYAGSELRPVDPEYGPRRQACAGPGWFEGPNYTQPRCAFDDFYIGPDDDGESGQLVPPQPTNFVDAIQKIMELCK